MDKATLARINRVMKLITREESARLKNTTEEDIEKLETPKEIIDDEYIC